MVGWGAGDGVQSWDAADGANEASSARCHSVGREEIVMQPGASLDEEMAEDGELVSEARRKIAGWLSNRKPLEPGVRGESRSITIKAKWLVMRETECHAQSEVFAAVIKRRLEGFRDEEDVFHASRCF